MRLLIAALSDRQRTDMIVDDLEDMGYNQDDISLLAETSYTAPFCRLLYTLGHSDHPKRMYQDKELVIGGPLTAHFKPLMHASYTSPADLLDAFFTSLGVPEAPRRRLNETVLSGGSVIAIPITTNDQSPQDLLESYSAHCICEVNIPQHHLAKK